MPVGGSRCDEGAGLAVEQPVRVGEAADGGGSAGRSHEPQGGFDLGSHRARGEVDRTQVLDGGAGDPGLPCGAVPVVDGVDVVEQQPVDVQPQVADVGSWVA